MQYYDFNTKMIVNDDRPEVEDLAKMYGTLDLLTAYIMRHLKCSKEKAVEETYAIHETIDRIIDDKTDNEENY